MFRRFFPTPIDDAPDETEPTDEIAPTDETEPADEIGPTDLAPASAPPPSDEPNLAALPVVGFTRRRMAMLLGVLVIGWIVILFARQVSEATTADGRAEAMVAANDQKRAELAGLERELDRIGQQKFIEQQARAYGLGGPKEIAFSLEASPPPLPSNAPGSAALRVGARTSVSPLERWLTLLFGPSD
jgi:cell division protein FtsB